MRYEILSSNLDKVKKLVDKIAKKGGDVVYEEGEPFFKEFYLYDEVIGNYTIKEEVVPVEIEASYKIEGFTPIAVINHLDEGNIVTLFSDNYKVDEKYYTHGPHCDHCNLERKRNKTILIEKEGEVKQVGLSCMEDYTGINADFLSTISQYISEIKEYGYFENYSTDDYVPISEYVASCFRAYKERGRVYIKTLNMLGEFEPDSTKEEGLKILKKRKFTEEDLKEAEESISLIKEQPEDYNNNYLTNLKILIEVDHCNVKYLGFLASIVSFKERYDRDKACKNRMEEKKLSSFQFNIGDRVNIEVSLIEVTKYYNDYGTVYLYEMMDNKGNIYIWKTSNKFDNGFYKVKGTVKEHLVYKEINQTVLTRCKLEIKED